MSWSPETGSLDVATLGRLSGARELRPSAVVDAVLARIARDGDPALWISRPAEAALRRRAAALDAADPRDPRLPLYGLPFAVKDNIDVAGLPTTAACPAFAYTPDATAPAVARLEAAGAILVGKTNLDQFATGLVGTRSPYGVPRNPFDPAYIPGGSSSGSATAVAKGLVSFALGTDTAGSGRVPAAFNNIVGLKPTRGLISAAGVVPACRSLDCVSILALTVGDAMAVLAAAAGDDGADPYGRSAPAGWRAEIGPLPRSFRLGVPRPDQREFFGNGEAARLYDAALARAARLGAAIVEIDYAPFRAVAGLLYGGPLVAERLTAAGALLKSDPAALYPATRAIISLGLDFSAADVFAALHRLAELRRTTSPIWGEIDALLLPTAGTIYRLAEIEADPLGLNTTLGHYTNFVNLLDLSAVAVPAGMQANGLPFGVTFVGPAWLEARLAAIADAFHHDGGLPLGATGIAQPARAAGAANGAYPSIELMVVGSHMAGLPLNRALTGLGARFVRVARTGARYRFYALPAGDPPRPGLVRVRSGGASIEGEIWAVPSEAMGAFLATVPLPLAIGTVELDDGATVKGFLCEGHAAGVAEDITHLGGWRAYLARGAARETVEAVSG
jgi:allophanate hydrolase